MGETRLEVTKDNGSEPKVEMPSKLLQDAWTVPPELKLPAQLQLSTEKPAASNLADIVNVDSLEALRKSLESTTKQVEKLQKTSGVYDEIVGNRNLLTNPLKLMAVSTDLAVLKQSPTISGVSLAGFAGYQGYHDFRNLLDQPTLAGRSKYAAALLADTALATGAAALVTDTLYKGALKELPARYKFPLIVGGLAVRAAIDFIPDPKK